MTYSVDQMRSFISAKGGFAQPSLWKVDLPRLPGVASSYDLNLLCRDVQLPGRQILTQERTIGMKPKKVAYAYGNDDVSMTFLVMNDYGIKEYFETWQSQIIDFDTQALNYKDEYTYDITISQLRKKRRPGATLNFNINLNASRPDDIFDFDIKFTETIYKCKLKNAFPTTLNALQLNNEQNGLLELNVQMSYDDWEST